MNKAKLLPSNQMDKLELILDEAWTIFKTSFVEGRFQITREAPFQHQFATILASLGNLYSSKADEIFYVDLETRVDGIRDRIKYVDISCGFRNSLAKAAIELKFKTKQQGAQDHGRIDAYIDIETLEILKNEKHFSIGRFFMITDSSVYINKSQKGVGTIFPMHHSFELPKNSKLISNSKGREDIAISLEGQYLFTWEELEPWYFLSLKV